MAVLADPAQAYLQQHHRATKDNTMCGVGKYCKAQDGKTNKAENLTVLSQNTEPQPPPSPGQRKQGREHVWQ